MAKFLFWLSVGVVSFTYFGYPALLGIWGWLRPRKVHKAAILPSVSVVVTAHNGVDYFSRKITNLLEEVDYPPDKFEVVLVSDGSTDGTLEQAQCVSDPRFRLFALPARSGKPTALNLGVKRSARRNCDLQRHAPDHGPQCGP